MHDLLVLTSFNPHDDIASLSGPHSLSIIEVLKLAAVLADSSYDEHVRQLQADSIAQALHLLVCLPRRCIPLRLQMRSLMLHADAQSTHGRAQRQLFCVWGRGGGGGGGGAACVMYHKGSHQQLAAVCKLSKSAALSTSCWMWQACCRDYLRTLGWECCSYYTILLQAEKACSQIFHLVVMLSVASTSSRC